MRKNEVNSFKKMLGMSVMVFILLSSSLFAGVPVNIMPLGDSITHASYRDVPNEKPDGNLSSYRNDLWYTLQGNGYDVDFVGSLTSGEDVVPPFDFDHEGHDGLTKSDMAANVYDAADPSSYLKAAADAGNPPDIVLLHIGTNGIRDEVHADDINLTLEHIDDYESDYSTHVKVILARIINCNPNWNPPAGVSDNICNNSTAQGLVSDSLTAFNDNVVTMANTRIANGDDIVIVDMESALNYDASDMLDDLHPNDSGYAKMANVWYSALENTLTTNQEHHWNFDEDNTATVYADSHNIANGTCSGAGCPTAVDGIINGAQEFDGSNNIVNITDTSNFDWGAGESFTIEYWMKSDQTNPSQNMVAIGRFAGTNLQWWVGVDQTDNKVRLKLKDNGANSTDVINAGPVVTDNRWHHIVAVRDVSLGKVIVYVDGVNIASVADNSSTDFTGGMIPVNIGGLGTGFYFDGVLDEVAIYNSVMDAAQINRRFQNGIGGFEITSTPVTSATFDSSYIYNVITSDTVAAVGKYTLPVAPTLMGIDDDGKITWQTDIVGNIPVTVIANNGNIDASQSFEIKVRDTASLPSGMTHYWKLNEADPADKTYLDAYNGATDAICNIGCPTQVTGQVDEAQDFSILNSDLNVPDDDSFDWGTGDSFTIEYWMKSDQTNPANNMVAIGRYGGANLQWWVGVDKTDNKVRVKLKDNLGNSTDVTTVGPVLTDNSWHHIVAVRDVSIDKVIVYVDGNEIASVTDNSNTNFAGTIPINIGNLNGGFYFDGTLDDIAIFNSALPANEIKAHYNNGVAGNGLDNPDVIAPVITLAGANPQEILIGDAYAELGATAEDDIDGDVSANIVIDASAVNTSVVGSYTVSYEVDDTAGNTGTATRTVNVTTGDSPVIILTGDNPYTIEVDSTYTDPGASATDSEDGTVAVTNDSATSVNTAIVGPYTVTYTATDSHGNTSQATRTVEVVDTTVPVIALAGALEIYLLVGDTYIEEGATCTDNYDATCTVTIGGDTVDTSTVGIYTVTYNATDASGNDATQVIRTVNVTVGIAPVITLDGDNPYTVEVHSTYTDPGASATDSEDGTVTVTNDSATSVNTAIVGTYTVAYTATDSHGNTSQATRTVEVVDTTAPVITLTGDATINLLVGVTYTEEGATCTDNYDATCSVTVGGDTVDTATVGSYIVTYDAIDAASNTAVQVTRTVNVADEPVDDWYTVSPDGNTYTAAASSVEIDSNLFTITVGTDSIVFAENGSDPKVYITMKSNGEVSTGYTEGSVKNPTLILTVFAPGTKVSVGANMVLLIETPLTKDLPFGDK